MIKKLTHEQNAELERILELVRNNEIMRMGTIFNTDFCNYFFDTGTGKVIQLDDESFYIIEQFFLGKYNSIEQVFLDEYIKIDSLIELVNISIKENLFKSPKPVTLYTPNHFENLDFVVNNQLEQVILEVTGECNLRCGYCIYNEEYERNRTFNNEVMNLDIAQRSVDYAFQHSSKNLSITFYGGEPLLKFDTIKWVIEYSEKENIKYGKNISYSLTTNLSLMTDEIAEYLSKIKSLSILCSIDGPKEIHNSYRKNTNGDGSFNKVIDGFEKLCKAFERNCINSSDRISVNAVFGPPYTYDKLEEIFNFFNNLDYIPNNLRVNITYPTSGSMDNIEWIDKMSHNSKYKSSYYNQIDPLWKWFEKKYPYYKNKKCNISIEIEQLMLRINNRYISNIPKNQYNLNGCCVPATRRLYINTKGEFMPCERIGLCPTIGDIYNGINIEKIKKYYVNDYVKKSISKCSDCWAIRLCGLCYAGRYNQDGFVNNSNCEGARAEIKRSLSYYHYLLDEDKDQLDYLNDIIVQ